jgi:hypothetical protein
MQPKHIRQERVHRCRTRDRPRDRRCAERPRDPDLRGYTDRQDRRTAITDIHVLQTAVARFRTEFGRLPSGLNGVAQPGLVDPWGNPYEYLNIEDMQPGDKPRKD